MAKAHQKRKKTKGGKKRRKANRRGGIDIVLGMDVSESMGTTDILLPGGGC